MLKRFLLNWLPVILWCSLIFILSGTPNLKTDFGFWDTVLRKIAHVTEYAVLFLLMRRAIAGSFPGATDSRVSFAAFLLSLVYASSDEIHQAFVPTRGPSVIDVGIDTLGIIFGDIVYRMYKRIGKTT